MEKHCLWFKTQHDYKEGHKCIQKATIPQALDASAEAIADQVNGEHALPPQNMRGLFREEAHKINDVTEREIASLRSKLEKF